METFMGEDTEKVTLREGGEEGQIAQRTFGKATDKPIIL